jgi:hypothetical protein
MDADRVQLIEGDSRDAILTIADASIDSVVTDGPYALVSIVKPSSRTNSPRRATRSPRKTARSISAHPTFRITPERMARGGHVDRPGRGARGQYEFRLERQGRRQAPASRGAGLERFGDRGLLRRRGEPERGHCQDRRASRRRSRHRLEAAQWGGMRKPEPKRRNGEQFSRPARRKDAALKAVPCAPAPLKLAEPEPVRDAGGKHLTMLTVGTRQCRWPHGEPKHPDFHLCGHAAQGPYCEFHRARAGALYARRSA